MSTGKGHGKNGGRDKSGDQRGGGGSSSDEGGTLIEPLTARGRSWPGLSQFAIFMENRVGRLHDLLRLFEGREIRVVALSISNSVDCAIARLIVSDSDRAREILTLSRFSFSETDVIGIELPAGSQPFVNICLALLQTEVNIQYTYPLLYQREGRGAIALYVDDIDQALHILAAKGLHILTEDDLSEENFGG